MSAGNIKLTSGAIQFMMNGTVVNKPVLQILGIKRLSNGERYRLMVSDGDYSSSFAMVATQLNHHFDGGNIDKYSVIRINEYICNQSQGTEMAKRIIIILDFALLATGSVVGTRIGDPIAVEKAGETISKVAPPTNNNVSVTSTNEVQKPPQRFPFSENTTARESRRDSLQPSNKMVHPISSVSPYQNRWTIKARVTSKTAVRTFTNARGEGKYFTMEVIDDSGEIKATAFGEQCDKYFDKMELNKVYYISRGTVKPANKTFNKTKNDYEMTFNNDTVVEPCCDSTSDVPMVQLSFVPIDQLNGREVNSYVDVIGVCKQALEVQSLIAKTTNRELKKRTVNLVDESNAEVAVTLWNRDAEDFDGSCNPVVAIKGAKVSDFGGVSLSLTPASTLLIDPDIPESHRIRSWYHSIGHKADYKTLTRSGSGGFSVNWKYLADIYEEKLGTKEKSDYITVKAAIGMIKSENAMYKACAEEQCKKKVVETPEGYYRCEKCNKENEKFKWNLIMQVSITDFSEAASVTCFQDSGEKILDKTSAEISAIACENDGNISSIINSALGKQYIFKLRVNSEFFNDEQKVRTSVMEVTKMNFPEYNKKLLADMKPLL